MDKVTEISKDSYIWCIQSYFRNCWLKPNMQTCKDKYFLKQCATHDNTDILNLIQSEAYYIILYRITAGNTIS